MANYNGTCRTNYAKFNVEKLKEVLQTIDEADTERIYVWPKYNISPEKEKEIIEAAIAEAAEEGVEATYWDTKRALFPEEFVNGIAIPEVAQPYLDSIAFGFEGGYPFLVDQDDNEIGDFADLVCPHLEDDSILIVMESGSEKMRYVTGYATAYNKKGEHVAININDIYDTAAKKFNVEREKITRAEY